jgi:hypothetical protein
MAGFVYTCIEYMKKVRRSSDKKSIFNLPALPAGRQSSIDNED